MKKQRRRKEVWAVLAVIIAVVVFLIGDNIIERSTGRSIFGRATPAATKEPAQSRDTQEPPSAARTQIPAASVTRSEVDSWTKGEVSEAEVDACLESVSAGGRPYVPFRAGDMVPAGVLVASDFWGYGTGKWWTELPVEPICHGGSWGLFESYESFVAPYEGAYYYIVP